MACLHHRIALWATFGVLFASGLAVQAQPAVQAHGSFKHMSRSGDTSGQVALADVTGAGLVAVGALAGLRGEVLAWEGRWLVSRGDDAEGRTTEPRAGDQAVLLASTRVTRWVEHEVPSAMTQAAFEQFVRERAQAGGLPAAGAWPFAVRGEFAHLVWHVVTGPASGGGHGGRTDAPGAGHGNPAAAAHGSAHAQGHARQHLFREPRARGLLVGFHSGPALEGVISHPGERFHVHYAAESFDRSGHVDGYTVQAGARLLLPAP